jgi:hypothetical protein
MSSVPRPSNLVESTIRRILNEDWDPIGVMDDPEWPRDEYDAYVRQICGMLTRGDSAEAIARHLCFIEEKRMGFGPVPEKARLPLALKPKAVDLAAPDR